jgi:integrase
MQGSIKKRVGKRGVTWSAVVDLGRDPVTGARKQKRLTARTRQDVEDMLTKTLHELRTGVYLEPSTQPLGEFLVEWHKTLTIRESTRWRYERIIARDLVPGLGAVPLGRLTAAHVQQLVTKKLERLSPQTVAQIYQVLDQALDRAVDWQLILRNPCQSVKPPRIPRREMHVWNPEQVRTFLTHTEGQELAALWRMALGTAMRQSELLALRWSDANLDRRDVLVTRTWSRIKGAWIMGDVKTAAGRRRISLPASCVQALKALRAERDLSSGDDLIWTFTPRVAGYRFGVAQQGTGLPRIRFHDLRHTSATLMLLNGEHPKVVSQRLGHSSVAITMDRYSHVLEGMQEDAADRLDALLVGDQMVTKRPQRAQEMA